MLVQLREVKIRTLGPFLILLTCQRFSDHTPLPSYLRLFFSITLCLLFTAVKN